MDARRVAKRLCLHYLMLEVLKNARKSLAGDEVRLKSRLFSTASLSLISSQRALDHGDLIGARFTEFDSHA